jgi:inositol oxygenase
MTAATCCTGCRRVRGNHPSTQRRAARDRRRVDEAGSSADFDGCRPLYTPGFLLRKGACVGDYSPITQQPQGKVVMAATETPSDSNTPLSNLDEWEDFLKVRYPEETVVRSKPFQATDANKAKEQFRNYEADARPSVREFYRLNHRHQTYDFVQAKKREFLSLSRRKMGIWEAMEFLNTLVDDSDPDTDLSQLDHLLQTAEQIRRDGHPRWFILTGLIHDLGKILCLYGEPQWAVVGDTFPVGCAFSDKIVFHQFFSDNPDSREPKYRAPNGIYSEGCGLENVHLSWGHDEYLYHVVKDYLPPEALYMIRYHSFYPAHREGEYQHLMNGRDKEMFEWVRAFNPYDLYTKSHERPNVEQLRPFYNELISEYFPAEVRW